MSYRSKRARAAKASKVQNTTSQSVQDIIAEVIHDVATGEGGAPETLASSSCKPSTDQSALTQQHNQNTTTEADDLRFYQRSTARLLSIINSPSPSLSSDPPRRLRGSQKRPLFIPAPEGAEALETQLNSCYDHWTEDTAMDEPTQEAIKEAYNLRSSKRNTAGRQPLTPPPTQSFPADSPSELRASQSQRRSFSVEEDAGEPALQGLSQDPRPKPPKWSDDIKFDEMDEVEMRDSEGKRGKKGGSILPRHVWSLQPGVRFVVPFNGLDQPVKKGGFVLIRFLGDVAKNGELCPIGEVNWHKVDKSCKAEIVILVREKFVLPAGEEIDKAILKHVGKKWRAYRHELKVQCKKPGKTQEQVASVVPEGVVPSQWVKLVRYWFSDKCQHLSRKGREARAAVSHLHTTGSKSFARKRDEFEKVHGREPGDIEWFVQTHRKKDGTFVDNSSKDFLDAAAALIAQRAGSSSSSQRVAIENQVFNELMYSDDEKCQRPLGYGFGVNKSKIFGVRGELRKRGYLASGTSAEGEFETMTRKNKTFGVGGSDSLAEVERLKLAMAAMSETNEIMQTQLQMQSQQLQMQSQQLQMQSQQMEGLRFQLQQVTSLLTKFGVMINNPPPVNPPPVRVPSRAFNFANPQVPEASGDYSDTESDSTEWDSD